MKRTAFLAALLFPLGAMAQGGAVTQSSSSSVSSSSVSDGNGNTVTTTTTIRDGKKETRRTVKGPDGKVISESTEGEGGEQPAQPAKEGGPWLGIHTGEVPDALRAQLDLSEHEGLLIEQLAADSPAGRAGLQKNDIIISYNRKPVKSPEELRGELMKGEPGEKVQIEYLRKGRQEKTLVTLGKRGDAGQNQPPPEVKPGGTAKTKASSRTVIVDKDGKTQVIENNQGGDPIEQMLKDPNVPEAMKDSLRKMQEQMREFNKRTEEMIPERKKTQDQ